MPLNKPADYPEWANTTTTLPVAGTANKVKPRTLMQTQGVDQGNFFPAQEANWLFANQNEWVQYLDQETTHINDTHLNLFTNVSGMQSDTLLEVGDYCRTLGYYSQGDSGSSIYEVKSTGIADGSKIISLSNGLLAHFVYTSNVIKARQFGANGDGVADDTTKLQLIIDLPEDESIDLFDDGIVVDLQGLSYSVSGLTFQNKTTIKNGTLLQRSAGDNILEHIGGATKSNGWSHLIVENVTFDGQSLGSGITTTADSQTVEDTITLINTNNGIFVDIVAVGINDYNINIKGCTFTNIYNTNITIHNNNLTSSKPVMTMEDCSLNGCVSTDPSTLSMVLFVESSNSDSDLTFDLYDCEIDTVNAISYSSRFCKTRFYRSTIITRDNESRLFLGSSNLLFKDCHLNLGLNYNGGLVYLSSLAYNIQIDNCRIETTFDAIHVRAEPNQCTYCELEINNSNIYTQVRVDRINNDTGIRIGANIYLNNTRFHKGFAADTDDILPNATTSTNTNLDVQDWDRVTITGCTFGMYSPLVVDDYQTGCQLVLRQAYTELNVSGNTVWVKVSDIMGWNSSMIYLGFNSPMVASVTGNTFKSIVGESGFGAVIGAGFGSLDIDHHVGLAGNLVEGFNHLMNNTVDGTTIAANYNR